MAQKPIAMEQLKQILQLKNDGISIREIARRVRINRNSVCKYLPRFDAGTDNLSDNQLADEAYYVHKENKNHTSKAKSLDLLIFFENIFTLPLFFNKRLVRLLKNWFLPFKK